MDEKDAILNDQGSGEKAEYVGPGIPLDITNYDPGKYEAEQRKERRQQMKLACLQLANNSSVTSDGHIVHEPSKILETAKEYYKFVRT